MPREDGHCSSTRINPATGKPEIFHEPTVAALVRSYQKEPDLKILELIVMESMPLIDSIILVNGFVRCGEQLRSLRSECSTKLMRIVNKHDPHVGSCFSFFSLALKRFLISHGKKISSRTKSVTFIGEEALENMEGVVYVSSDLTEEFLTSLDTLEVRHLGEANLEVVRYFLKCIVSEGMSTPKNRLVSSAVYLHQITPETGSFLYDFLIVNLRFHLIDRSPEPFSDLDILKMSKRFTLLPEIAQAIGPRSFAKLCTLFAGVTVTFPTTKDIRTLAADKAHLNGGEEEYARESMLHKTVTDDEALREVRLFGDGYDYTGHRRGGRHDSDHHDHETVHERPDPVPEPEVEGEDL